MLATKAPRRRYCTALYMTGHQFVAFLELIRFSQEEVGGDASRDLCDWAGFNSLHYRNAAGVLRGKIAFCGVIEENAWR